MSDANLDSLLDDLDEATRGEHEVGVEDLLEATGRRSFGPALLVPGLLLVTPVGGIPGVASAVGVLALLVVVQMILGRKRLWLPQWLLHRKIPAQRVQKALKTVRRPARVIDRLIRPRLAFVLQKPALEILAVACMAVGLTMPLLEAPFADTAPGLVLTAFGLALVAHDGLLALMAAALCVLCFSLVVVAL